jgi:steroid 5-alpha reductase family enzyme
MMLTEKGMKQKYFIDSHKGVTFLAILVMMAYFNQWQNPTAWVYLALHGTYGVLWALKSRIFPDKQWETDKGLWFGLVIWGGLSLYWHYAADMQKFIELKYNPGHLITDGLFSRTRNINYFGELLIYLGFSLLAMHWLPILVIVLYIVGVWFPNMLKKDKSLARYPEFAEYKRKSKLFIPFLF